VASSGTAPARIGELGGREFVNPLQHHYCGLIEALISTVAMLNARNVNELSSRWFMRSWAPTASRFLRD
jgi:hypothetical protein